MNHATKVQSAERRGGLHRLIPAQLKGLLDGIHGDGGGLHLRVDGNSRRWYFRYTRAGKTFLVPLGTLADCTLKQAREGAALCRRQLTEGKDPRAERDRDAQERKTKAVAVSIEDARAASTLEIVGTDYHAAHEHEWTEVHGKQWLASLKQHVFPKLGARPIADIKPRDLLDLLLPLRAKIPETTMRLRERLDVIFSDAILRELCESNPAAAIAKAMRGKRKRTHHAAMDWREVPEFLASLRKFDRISITTALAFEWMVLTAGRTIEVLGAKWDEIDEKAGTWTIPAERMKAREEHVVFLSDRAIQILDEVRPFDGETWLFPSAGRNGFPLSNMAFLSVLERMGRWGPKAENRVTAHGFRATFSTWANEQHHPRDVIEASLSHSEANAVRAAYNRAQYVEQRRALAQAWSDYCMGAPLPKRKAGRAALRVVRAAA